MIRGLRAVPDFLLRAARRLALFADPYWAPSYAQEGEDRVLARAFDGQSAGFYVEVGAHDPRRFSNTYAFYRRGWRGITIEPDPAAAAAFARLRPRDIHLQIGIAEAPGSLVYHRFDEPALNTFDAGVAARRGAAGRFRALEPATIAVDTLAAVLDRHLPRGQAIDFLSVDAEGYDLQVLRSGDWERFRPRYLLAESVGATLAGLDADPQRRFLDTVGYAPFAKTVHTVIYRDQRRA
jgi:FkbM family methyltransferase